jgi:hypothetical protein
MNNGSCDLPSFIRHDITKGMWHPADNPVGAQHTQTMSCLSGDAPFCFNAVRSPREQIAGKISISESVDVEFSSADRLQKGRVFKRPRTKRTNPMAFVRGGVANRPNDLAQETINRNRGKSIQIPFITGLGDLCPTVKISNPLTHPLPREGSRGRSFPWTIDLEVPRVVHGGLDSKHTALLVVDFDRVAFDLVLEADSFRTLTVMANDFPLEITVKFFAQETQDIFAAEHGDAASYQGRINLGQRYGRFEHNVGSPFTLVGRPIVGFPKRSQHRLMSRVETTGNPVEQNRPVGLQLLIHQLLDLIHPFNPRKTVLLPLVVQPLPIHLTAQPLPPVQTNLDGEREPTLNSGIHESKYGIHPVMIEEQTLPDPRLQLDLLLFPIPNHFVTLTGLHGGQNADQAVCDPILARNVTGDGFFVCLRRGKIDYWTPLPLRLLAGGILQLLTFLLEAFTNVFHSNPGIPEITEHSALDRQGSQSASQHQTVKSTQMTNDIFFILLYKGIHGVLLGVVGGVVTSNVYPKCDAISISITPLVKKHCKKQSAAVIHRGVENGEILAQRPLVERGGPKGKISERSYHPVDNRPCFQMENPFTTTLMLSGCWVS